jgi:hypothetical protein
MLLLFMCVCQLFHRQKFPAAQTGALALEKTGKEARGDESGTRLQYGSLSVFGL